MLDKKFHFYILTASLILCAFMYIDAYWVPLKTNSEIVTNAKRDVHYGSHGNTYHSFYIQTDKHNSYDATSTLYTDINIGDTITVHRSIITNSIQKISILSSNSRYVYNTGFIRVGTGALCIFLDTAGIIVFLIFYEYLKNMQGKKNLTYLLLIVTVILFLGHLNVSI